MDQYDKAKDYLLNLKYQVWYKVSDIPDEIRSESVDLIDESFRCKYYYSDEGTEFIKE